VSSWKDELDANNDRWNKLHDCQDQHLESKQIDSPLTGIKYLQLTEEKGATQQPENDRMIWRK
jgi:hypothetical protein